MNLSEHFTIEEFEYSDTARVKGISNKMNEAQIKEASHTCTYMLENIRSLANQHFNNKPYNGKTVKKVVMKITSGFRSDALNKAIPGSSKTSQHSKAQAVDFELVATNTDGTKTVIPYTETYKLIKLWCKLGYVPIDQCIQEKSGSATWVHVSLANQIKDCRKQFLIYKNGVYTLDTEK